LVKLRERATHDIPTQQAISQATGVAQTTPGCPRSKATKITAAAQVENGSHTAFPMALKSNFFGLVSVRKELLSENMAFSCGRPSWKWTLI
jgi:hypothetical protein